MAGVGLRTQLSSLAGWEMNSDGHLYLRPAFLLEAFAWGSLRVLAEVGSWLRVHALEFPTQQSSCFSLEATFLITSKLFK